MTAPTPEQMRALAGNDALMFIEVGEDIRATLRAAADQLEAVQALTLDQQTAVVRRLDAEFERLGGTTRHWVDYLHGSGYQIVKVADD